MTILFRLITGFNLGFEFGGVFQYFGFAHSIEENSEDVYSQDPSYRVPLRDSLEYYDNIYEEDEYDE